MAPVAMTGMALAAGWPTGLAPGPSRLLPLGRDEPHPRAALDDVLAGALRRTPCVVSFSGGRDSSVLLALAVGVARRRGLPDPIAASDVLDDPSAADDERWQRRLVAELGVEWVRTPAAGELDAIGATAQATLREVGVCWPPTAAGSSSSYELAAGGTLVTGEHGDELLGDHRLTPLVGTLRRRPRPTGALVGGIVASLAPRHVRRARWRAALAGRSPWLRPGAQRAHVGALADDRAAEPFGWRAALDHDDRLLAHRHGHRTLHALAGRRDVALVAPFADLGVRRAVAAAGGPCGWTSRTEALLRLFGDVVPEELLRRTSKARFNRVVMGPASRAFAEAWDGSGLPADVAELVDVERVRSAWLAGLPPPGVTGLLQAAWLGSVA